MLQKKMTKEQRWQRTRRCMDRMRREQLDKIGFFDNETFPTQTLDSLVINAASSIDVKSSNY